MPFIRTETHLYPPDLLANSHDAPTVPTAPETTANPAARAWWAIYTKARQEKSLARDLLTWQIPFYLPLVTRTHVIGGKRRKSQVPLFGGYLFLWGTPEERGRALTTNRISQTLAVPDQRQLQFDLSQVERLITANAPLTVESRLQPGQRVRVKSGALLGVEGTVAERRTQSRLIVEVRFLQQGVSLEVEDYYLEPI
ncbi:MAG: antitermination protein NusG [Pirellulales bacterium]|nr:antitermination protein NusG [Pirellulales bacterium]